MKSLFNRRDAAQRINEVRCALDLTLDDVTKLIHDKGYSLVMRTRHETGNAEPPLELLHVFADDLRVPSDYILFGDARRVHPDVLAAVDRYRDTYRPARVRRKS